MDSDDSRSIALLSIHPEYAEAILAGRKRVEFRRTKMPPELEFVVVYATSPVKKIIGYFSVAQVRTGAASTIWRQYSDVGGISRSKFNAYYAGAGQAVAIEVGTVYPLDTPLALERLGKNIRPPQSFQYISRAALQRISTTHREQLRAA